MPHLFFEPSIARPPNDRERAVLQLRLDRLSAMQRSMQDADARLQALAATRSTPPGDFRLRHGFVRLASADSAADTSDRRATSRQHRPPGTRLMSARGRALSFELIALFEAQMRLMPGQPAERNQLPITAGNETDGWTNYIATDATDATEGKIFTAVRTKKSRQIQSGLNRLAGENLVRVPRTAGRRRYDDFVLMREDAAPTGDNDVYRVPELENSYFTVPLGLFTNGWIHVLDDSELVLLLIAARLLAKHGGIPQPLASGPRKLNYGLSRDSFETGHRMLDYLGLLDVISDWRRNADGTVDGFRDRETRGAQPHLLRFHPEVLDNAAYPIIVDTITSQLAKSEKT